MRDPRAAPLLYVVADITPDMEHGNDPPEPDPWCLACGARVADGLGLSQHARWHNFQSHEYQTVTERDLRQWGWI